MKGISSKVSFPSSFVSRARRSASPREGSAQGAAAGAADPDVSREGTTLVATTVVGFTDATTVELDAVARGFGRCDKLLALRPAFAVEDCLGFAVVAWVGGSR